MKGKNVLYIGDVETSKMFTQVAEKTKAVIRPISGNKLTAQQISDLVLDKNSSYFAVIINLNEIPNARNNYEYFVNEIIGEDNTRLCIMCPGYNRDSHEIDDCLNCGVQFFMLYPSSSGNQNVFLKLMDPNVTSNLKDVFLDVALDSKQTETKKDESPLTTEEMQEKETANKDVKTPIELYIGGTVDRIGVTFITTFLLKNLVRNGFKACYVDATKNDSYMMMFFQAYSSKGTVDKEHHKLTYEGIDFYTRVTPKIMEYLMNEGYDYIAYDFGNVLSHPNKLETFLRGQKLYLISGARVNEFGRFKQVMDNITEKQREKLTLIFHLVERDGEPVIDDYIVKKYGKKPYFLGFIFSEFKENPKRYSNIKKIFNINEKEKNNE